jgi:hypothetical protein
MHRLAPHLAKRGISGLQKSDHKLSSPWVLLRVRWQIYSIKSAPAHEHNRKLQRALLCCQMPAELTQFHNFTGTETRLSDLQESALFLPHIRVFFAVYRRGEASSGTTFSAAKPDLLIGRAGTGGTRGARFPLQRMHQTETARDRSS